MYLHHLKRIWVELGNIPHTLEKKCVSEFTRSTNEFVQLAILCEDLSVTLVCSQVDSEGNQLLSHKMLWGVNYKLVHKWNTICVGKRRLSFIFKTQMIEQLDNLRPKTRSFQCVNKFWYHTLIIHLNSNLLVETEVEEHSQSNLQQKSVVAGDEAVQFLDDSQVFHLIFVFSKNRQLLQEV